MSSGFAAVPGTGFCAPPTQPIPSAFTSTSTSTFAFAFARPTDGIRSAPWASLTLGRSSASDPVHRPTALFALAEAGKRPIALKRVTIKGDGRCMFRAMAQGLAKNKGGWLRPPAEEVEADQLRLAVAEALCRSPKRRSEFKEAVKAVQQEDNLPRYCQRIQKPDFWGGEPELLILSKMLQVPLFVYLAEEEQGLGDGYRPIMRYGEEYLKSKGDRKARKPVRLLFTGGNHYDLLLKA